MDSRMGKLTFRQCLGESLSCHMLFNMMWDIVDSLLGQLTV